jgi:hypothetical protein
MGLVVLIERHAKQIGGAQSGFDRVMAQGTQPVFCYADGMTAYWATATTFASKVPRVRHSMGLASIQMYDKFGGFFASRPRRRIFLFQALPRGRTTPWRIGDEVRTHAENYLQSGPAAGSFVGSQPPVPGVSMGHGRSWQRSGQAP